MNKIQLDDIIDAANALDWSVYTDEPRIIAGELDPSFGLEFRKYSPAGEDFSFYVSTTDPVAERAESLVREVVRYAIDFDPEEHAAIMLGANGAPGLFELCDDAKAIAAMLEELSDALNELVHGKPVSIAETVAQDDGLVEYTVSIAIDGRLDVTVRAPKGDFEKARELALLEVCDTDGTTLEVVGMQAVNAEDELGEFRDY